MPTDKNKIARFKMLDRCFADKTKKYYLQDLKEACEKALKDIDARFPNVSRSTLFNDLNEMKLTWPGAELIERKYSSDGIGRYYRYKDPKFSIWKQAIDGQQLAQLQSVMLMLRQFKDFPQSDTIEDIIEQFEETYDFELGAAEGIIAFESNENVDALSLVGVLFSYITKKQVLSVDYKPFNKELAKYRVHPHFLKQYNRRWFLIGYTESQENHLNRSVFGLDRIKSIDPIQGEYIPSDVDLEELFDDQIGVTIIKADPVKITLRFSPHRFPYVLSKPMHISQRMVKGEDYTISIEVSPNKELFQTLLSFGADVEVVAPIEIREKLQQEVEKLFKLYKSPETLD